LKNELPRRKTFGELKSSRRGEVNPNETKFGNPRRNRLGLNRDDTARQDRSYPVSGIKAPILHFNYGEGLLMQQELVLKDGDFHRLSKYVYETAGINLHKGKKELVKARLGKIIRQREFQSFGQYYEHVINDTSGHELTILLDSISTNLTYFFREPQHFKLLTGKALPEVMRRKETSRNKVLRFWSAGCSSGEEAYSIAIAVQEALTDVHTWQVKILASDLSTKVLARADAGIYDEKKLKAIPYELKRKYFQKGNNSWKGYFRAKKDLRNMITFSRLNFMENFHFAEPFDLIFCRNVMIYFDNPIKEIIVGKLFRYLAVGGYLFIGHAESLTGLKHRFRYIQPSLYQKMEE
jgi:chemotaxis protein methyltransferase CheR